MRRRTWLQSLAAFVVLRPWARVSARLQSTAFSAADIATLEAIAEIVLPTVLTDAERKTVVSSFVRWGQNYREGADRGHGYGDSRLTAPTSPSPVSRYPAQFAALEKAAADRGARSFAALPRDARRAVVEASLEGPQPVARFSARPTGANLIADFMGLYYNSPDAYDLCYQREIRRDQCRTLTGSENEPPRRRS